MACLDNTTSPRPDERQPVPAEIRFQRYIGPTTESGCILWAGCKNAAGYGVFSSGKNWSRNRLAHRIAYERKNGPIPEGLKVLHRCDNPPCINPDHLFLGTDADNVADKVAKGRGASGERNGHSKLKASMVLEIREQHATGEYTHKDLSHKHRISRTIITRIVNRTIWRDI